MLQALNGDLDRDGIVSALYFLIWKRAGSVEDNQNFPGLLSMTVEYEHNFPKSLYYYSAKTREITRRQGKDIDVVMLFQEFTSYRYIGRPDDVSDVVATYLSKSDDGAKGGVRVDFLNKQDLKDLLFHGKKRPDGFLQKWVHSTGKSNSVIQAVWSPHLCVVSKRENNLPLRDKRYPLYDRCVTVEGPAHFSREACVAPHVKKQVENRCKDIVDRIMAVEKVAVRRMVIYFKVDHKSEVWLLWCNSMRTLKRDLITVGGIFEPPLQSGRDSARTDLLASHWRPSAGGDSTVKFRPPSVKHGASGAFVRSKPREVYPEELFGEPSLGELGDTFTECPLWSVHRDEMREFRRRQIQMKQRGEDYTQVSLSQKYRRRKKKRGKAQGSHDAPSMNASSTSIGSHLFDRSTEKRDRAQSVASVDFNKSRRKSRKAVTTTEGRYWEKRLMRLKEPSPEASQSLRPVGNFAHVRWGLVRLAVISGFLSLREVLRVSFDFISALTYALHSVKCGPKPHPGVLPSERPPKPSAIIDIPLILLRKAGLSFLTNSGCEFSLVPNQEFFEPDADIIAQPRGSGSHLSKETRESLARHNTENHPRGRDDERSELSLDSARESAGNHEVVNDVRPQSTTPEANRLLPPEAPAQDLIATHPAPTRHETEQYVGQTQPVRVLRSPEELAIDFVDAMVSDHSEDGLVVRAESQENVVSTKASSKSAGSTDGSNENIREPKTKKQPQRKSVQFVDKNSQKFSLELGGLHEMIAKMKDHDPDGSTTGHSPLMLHHLESDGTTTTPGWSRKSSVAAGAATEPQDYDSQGVGVPLESQLNAEGNVVFETAEETTDKTTTTPTSVNQLAPATAAGKNPGITMATPNQTHVTEVVPVADNDDDVKLESKTDADDDDESSEDAPIVVVRQPDTGTFESEFVHQMMADAKRNKEFKEELLDTFPVAADDGSINFQKPKLAVCEKGVESVEFVLHASARSVAEVEKTLVAGLEPLRNKYSAAWLWYTTRRWLLVRSVGRQRLGSIASGNMRSNSGSGNAPGFTPTPPGASVNYQPRKSVKF